MTELTKNLSMLLEKCRTSLRVCWVTFAWHIAAFIQETYSLSPGSLFLSLWILQTARPTRYVGEDLPFQRRLNGEELLMGKWRENVMRESFLTSQHNLSPISIKRNSLTTHHLVVGSWTLVDIWLHGRSSNSGDVQVMMTGPTWNL